MLCVTFGASEIANTYIYKSLLSHLEILIFLLLLPDDTTSVFWNRTGQEGFKEVSVRLF